SLPKLKYIGILATGTNVVNLAAARERGIDVTNIPAYSAPSVSQTVFALLLSLANQVTVHDKAVHEGEWENCEDFCFTKAPLMELSGKTLGIVGYGMIGGMAAEIGRAFGMKVIATARTPKNIEGVEFVETDELFSRSDVISLHCPLTEQTKGIVNAGRIALMKKSAFIINTGRGGLVDEKTLADALNSGRIAGAGLDVLSTEPPAPDNPLLKAKNCVITPHIAWATRESRARLIATAAANLDAFAKGEPVNVVNRG
ncbi:MAG: D-2-hydroxyacid dehydrogenase, partial [Planctomycetes bacterium]|nr:D-2-hydroxyacid dehydrogenase [Planctomycetota bacterium]